MFKINPSLHGLRVLMFINMIRGYDQQFWNCLNLFWEIKGGKKCKESSNGCVLIIFFIHKQESLNVKDKKITTTPAAEDLKSLFTPGKEFRFNATLEIEKSEIEATNSTSSEVEQSSQ